MNNDGSTGHQARATASSERQSATEPSAPVFELATSPRFPAWLAAQRSSLVFTTYQTGKLFLIGLQPNGRLSIFERTLERVMGLHATASTFAPEHALPDLALRERARARRDLPGLRRGLHAARVARHRRNRRARRRGR